MAAVLRARGFSLVEMMVAVGLIAGCLLILLTAFPTASRAVRQADGLQTATFLAGGALERTRSLPYDSMTGGSTSADLAVVRNGQPMTLRFVVDVQVTETASGLKLLRATARWTDVQPRMVSLETYAARL